jgi:CelD/BcsL family acetyltransferase involved in cellulose biosynthesis
MLHVREINDLEELAACGPAWQTLLPQTAGATFFHSWEWFQAYWSYFGRQQRLRTLLVYEGDACVGVVPLTVLEEATAVGRIHVLTYPLHDWGTFYGPIGPQPEPVLQAALRHVRSTPRDWDLLDLRWVDLAGVDQQCTMAAMRSAGFRPWKQAWARAGAVEIQGTWDAYWQGRNKKWRQNIERCQRRLPKLGRLEYVRYRPLGAAAGEGDPRWDWYDACVRVAGRGWQGSATDGTTLCHDEIAQFLRTVHALAAQAGCLDLNLLLIDEQPAAFAYNYHYRGRVDGLRMGFDPQFAAVGPGHIMLRMVLEDSFRRGDTFYDLGAGYLDCKRAWMTTERTSYRLTHFPAALSRVQLLRWKRWLIERIYGDRYVVCAHLS